MVGGGAGRVPYGEGVALQCDYAAARLTRLHVASSALALSGPLRVMELADLLAKAGSLPEPQQRKVAAILGSLVADAAGRSGYKHMYTGTENCHT